MKILFVATVYRHLTAFHLPHMDYFKNRGFDVWAISGEGEYDKKILMERGITCVDVPFSRNPLDVSNIKAYKELKKIINREKFNYIDVHTPIASFLTRLASRKFKETNVVYTAHGFHFYEGAPTINWIIYYTAERLAAKWTEQLITINEEDYRNSKKLRIDKERVSFMHGVGVDFPSYSYNELEIESLKKELFISKKNVVISYVAEINDNKNHLYILQNWNKIKQHVPDAILLVIGKGFLEQTLMEYVKKNNLEGIRFLGYRRDVDMILKFTDIVMLLSKREGLPKSIMEAMVNKLPCIVSDTRGLRDLVVSNKNGYVVKLNADLELINAVVKLVEDKSLRLKYGEASFEMIQPFLLKNTMNEYKEIYQLIESRGLK